MRAACLILLLALLLSACSKTRTPLPATPTARLPSPTPVSSPTPRPSLIPTATSLPETLVTSGTKEVKIKLKAWTEDDAAAAWVESDQAPVKLPYTDADRPFFQEALLYENLLRFPVRSKFIDLDARLAMLKSSNPYPSYGFVHDHAAAPLAQALEKALNEERIAPSSLNTWLKNQADMSVVKSLPAPNLFGDGQDATLLQIFGGGGMLADVVLREEGNGKYTVIPLEADWQAADFSENSIEIYDFDQNGQPEIGFSSNYPQGYAGKSCARSFDLLAWDGKEFRDLLEKPIFVFPRRPVLAKCEEIRFTHPLNSPVRIVATVRDRSSCTDPAFDYVENSTFTWDGALFRPDPYYAPGLPKLLPLVCSLEWAVKAGAQDNAALDVLTRLNQTCGQTDCGGWDAETLGFYRLKLAAWFFQWGRDGEGLALFQQVADLGPESSLPARLAQTFLDVYPTGGAYQAAKAVRKIVIEEISRIAPNTRPGLELIKTEFTEDLEVSFAWSGMYRSLWDTDRLAAWLKANMDQFYWSQAADLNGDGKVDLLAMVEDQGVIKCWAFLNIADAQINPLELLNGAQIDDPSLLYALTAFTPSANAPLVNVLRFGSDLLTFHFTPGEQEGEWTPRLDVIIRAQQLDPNLSPKDWEIQDYAGGKALVVHAFGHLDVYEWSPALGALVSVGASPQNQGAQIGAAEQALFAERDYPKAEALLKSLLSGKVWEETSGYEGPPTLRVYLTYLLGLSYELNGDGKDALLTYWDLAQTHPGSLFAWLAEKKIVVEK